MQTLDKIENQTNTQEINQEAPAEIWSTVWAYDTIKGGTNQEVNTPDVDWPRATPTYRKNTSRPDLSLSPITTNHLNHQTEHSAHMPWVPFQPELRIRLLAF